MRLRRTKKLAFILTVLLGVIWIGCVASSRQRSILDSHPEFIRVYTQAEIADLTGKFKADPSSHSQAYGELILRQMYLKSPGFAWEFVQLPELGDGINAAEARAMKAIYDLIEPIDIPPALFEPKLGLDGHMQRFIFEWTGDTGQKKEWRFSIGKQGSFKEDYVLEMKTIGFEDGEDKIEFKDNTVTGSSFVNNSDTDGLTVRFNNLGERPLYFSFNDHPLYLSPERVLCRPRVYDERNQLEGKLTVRNALQTQLSPQQIAVRDLVMAGWGDQKYSAPLQAMLWGFMSGYYLEGDNPFEMCLNALALVKPIWGDMTGERWENFETVVARLNLPELVDYYERIVFKYKADEKGSDTSQHPKITFQRKTGDCEDNAIFAAYCLEKAGYKVKLLAIHMQQQGGHVVAAFQEKDKFYILDNSKAPNVTNIKGPFDTKLNEKSDYLDVRRMIAEEAKIKAEEIIILEWAVYIE